MTLPTDKATTQPMPGNGVTRLFDFDVYTWDTDELEVWYKDGTDGVPVKVTTDLSIALNADQDNDPGGTVTYPVAADVLSSSEYITVKRKMPFTQEDVDMSSAGSFDPTVMERALDRATAERQELKEELSRSLSVSPGEDISATYLEDCQAAQAAAQTAQSGAETAETGAQTAQAAAEAAAASALQNVVEDITPELGGNLDAQDNQIIDAVMKNEAEVTYAFGSVSGAQSVNMNNGNVQTMTPSGALTISFTNPPASGTTGIILLEVTDGGAQTITWPVSVTWDSGAAPTLQTSGKDYLLFITNDAGTNWYGKRAWKEA